MTAGVVEQARLQRALALHVEEREPDRVYRVTGGREPHQVRRTQDGWTCDCMDQLYAGERACKHRLAAYLHRQLTPEILAGLRQALEAAERTIGPLSGGAKSAPGRGLPTSHQGTVEPTVGRSRG